MEMETMLNNYDLSLLYGDINVLSIKMKCEEKKAIVLVTKDETFSMLVVLNRINDIWKISSLDTNFTGNWYSLNV